MNDILSSLQEVIVEKPVDIIIRQIKDLVTSGQLHPGDKLPSERKLSERFGVGRTHVRDAIKKLEFYGILRTLPQSGTIVAGLEISAIEGLIADVLKLDNSNFYSLAETRLIIERNAARLCTLRRTEEDLINIEKAVNRYELKSKVATNLVEEDFAIHRAIADGSKNPVLKSLLLIIMPDLLNTYIRLNVCNTPSEKTIKEHQLLLQQIRNKDVEGVVNTINVHLANICTFAKEHSKVNFSE
ncbi:MAG: FadR family transcriptional regulator [Prevotellaceae bacterium]|jgi:GntR family transcriptional repressor for pyruvate dehydrogenase complex|nr:FadR family transcriptional regulator [Prevotellaceae bacterium]